MCAHENYNTPTDYSPSIKQHKFSPELKAYVKYNGSNAVLFYSYKWDTLYVEIHVLRLHTNTPYDATVSCGGVSGIFLERKQSLLQIPTILCNLSNKEEVIAIFFGLPSSPLPFSPPCTAPPTEQVAWMASSAWTPGLCCGTKKMHIRPVVLGLCDSVSYMKLKINFSYLHLWKVLCIKEVSNPWPYEI